MSTGGWGKRDAKRIAVATRAYEQHPRTQFKDASGNSVVWCGKLAVVTTAIGAASGTGSGTTLGAGVVTLYTLVAAGTLTAMAGATGIAALSMFTTSIPVGTLVGLMVIDGLWVVCVVAC